MSNDLNLKILYVEDEDDIRSVGTMAMEIVGNFTVHPCASGTEALEATPVFQPHLIILDVMMPGMNGPETFAKLRQTQATANIPVIFMTAKVQADEIEEYMNLGAIGVIGKPFDPMTVSDQIRALWEKTNG